MSLIEINWNPTSSELRKFGWTMLTGFAVIGMVLQFGFGVPTAAYVAYGLGVVLGLLGLSGTIAGRWGYRAWMSIAFVMGNIVSRVLLALIYFGLFTPLGWCRRMLGNDELQLKKPSRDSYWSDVPKATRLDNAQRQF
jgi:hypothetical protein